MLAVLCLQFLALGVVQAWQDSPTFDEQYHLAAGVTALTRHQLRITPEHPPLGEALAAVPVLAARPVIPTGRSWRSGDSDAYAGEFMQAQIRAGALRRVTFLGRLVPLAAGAAIGLLAFVLASELFGPAAGLFAATVWLTLPLTLGLAHLNGVDIPFTLATLALSLVLLKYLRVSTTRRALVVGLVCGLALTARLNAFVLIPTILAIVAVAGRRSVAQAARHAGVIVATSWGAVWLVYRLLSPFPHFRHVGLPRGSVPFSARLVLLAPWPSEFAYGIRKQALVAQAPGPAYLLGHVWRGARWWYWPGSMLVKLPASTLIVMLVGLWFWRGIGQRSVWEAAVVLGVPAVALTAFILPQPRDLGLRYLLPVIALGIVAGSPLVRFASRATAGRIVVGLIVVAQLFWLWESSPRSLGWTAPPFRPGYQVAADSNLDWGQDLYRLRTWGRDHPGAVVFYFGPLDPALLVPHSRSLVDAIRPGGDGSGWWAVSASLLTDYYSGTLAWLRAYCPVGLVGDSILLYRFRTQPDLNLHGPDRPTGVCHAAFSRNVVPVRSER
jgi:hypothetical protein